MKPATCNLKLVTQKHQQSPMEKRAYYYLVSGLPTLIFEQAKPPFSMLAFREELQYHLHPADYRQVLYLFLPADNRNLLHILQKDTGHWDEQGQYTEEQLEAFVREPETAPAYMRRFIEAYQQEAPLAAGMSWENQLTQLYYDSVLEQTAEGFLFDWFSFERDIHNLKAAFTARRYQLSQQGQLIGDYRLTEAARNSNARDFGLSGEYPFINRLLMLEEEPELLEREEETDILRWNYIDELNTFNYFTIEVLLGYLLKLSILERWSILGPEEGLEAFRGLVRRLEQSFEFPKAFSVS